MYNIILHYLLIVSSLNTRLCICKEGLHLLYRESEIAFVLLSGGVQIFLGCQYVYSYSYM